MKTPIFHSKWMLVTALLVIALSFIPSLMPPVYAIKPAEVKSSEGKPPSPSAQPIGIGIYILNVGNLDMNTGNYSMDFYLNFSCATPCDPDTFDIMNGRIDEKEDQTSDDANGTWRAYRVRASLITNLDVRDYPFDEHNLVIEIEDKKFSNQIRYYVPDDTQSGVDSSAVVSGWELKKTTNNWHATVVDHYYPAFDSTYSRYQFYVTIFHPWQSSFLKGLFAPIVIVLVGLLSVLMNEEKISDRLALTTSSLVGAILYHLSVISSIPPVGYLTYMDKFMLVNYFVIAAALAVTVAMMVYQEREEHTKAKRINQWTRGLIPFAWIILLALITLTQFALH